jgi:hypothetical protein
MQRRLPRSGSEDEPLCPQCLLAIMDRINLRPGLRAFSRNIFQCSKCDRIEIVNSRVEKYIHRENLDPSTAQVRRCEISDLGPFVWDRLRERGLVLVISHDGKLVSFLDDCKCRGFACRRGRYHHDVVHARNARRVEGR